LIEIEDLICGQLVDEEMYSSPDLSGVVKRLRADVAELHKFIQAPSSFRGELPAFAVLPFFLRKFLELSTISLLARVDPIRVIAARKNQLNSSYEEGKPNPSSIVWRGDIVAKTSPPKDDVWSASHIEKGIERSLLGWHIGLSAIEPGLKAFADAENSANSQWFKEFTGVDKPFEWIKSELGRLYSTLSKGIHAEYLLDEVTLFDDQSLEQHKNDCYKFILILATSTHHSPLFYRSLRKQDAINIFFKIEKTV
jgi:hypothetical protein